MTRTRTQKKIMEEVREDPNGMTIFEFTLKPDGSISNRRDLEAIDELIRRGDLRQINRGYEIKPEGWFMWINVDDPQQDHLGKSVALSAMAEHIAWDLPAHHKGFLCQYGHDQIVRAAERAIQKTLAGERAKRCQCRYCIRQRKDS